MVQVLDQGSVQSWTLCAEGASSGGVKVVLSRRLQAAWGPERKMGSVTPEARITIWSLVYFYSVPPSQQRTDRTDDGYTTDNG